MLNRDRTQTKPDTIAFLERIHRFDALTAYILEDNGALLFANGNTTARCKLLEHMFSGIKVSPSTIGYVDVTPRVYLACGVSQR